MSPSFYLRYHVHYVYRFYQRATGSDSLIDH